MISRRNFLKASSVALTAGLAHPFRAWAEEAGITMPGEDGMILRSFRFLDLEMPVEYFDSWLTPVPRFFVRNHMHEPSTLDPAEWRLHIGGEVNQPLKLSLDDLGKFAGHSLNNTLECAGNGRAFQQPHVPGIQWQKGAVGTAHFSGPRLRDLLLKAGVKPAGKHVMFRGLDEVPGQVPPFIRSIPIEKAMDADTLVATHMNGAPLTRHHGFPARSLVPGWVGAASCKWLTEIRVLDREFEGNFMNPGYRLPNTPVKPGEAVKPEDTHVVTELAVKSVIVGPADGATVKGRTIQMRGAAWAGEADIAKVEISTDSGTTWELAHLGTEKARYAWRLWSYEGKDVKPGEYVLMSRATDNRGRTQPATPVWNPSGYLYNTINRVTIHVEP